jgi:hypothetical protein
MRFILRPLCLLFVVSPLLNAQSRVSDFPSLREQARIQQEWLKIRLEKILPALMRQNGVQMWIVPMHEYNEDPVFSLLVSATTFAARRRTIYVFFDRGEEKWVERFGSWRKQPGRLVCSLP